MDNRRSFFTKLAASALALFAWRPARAAVTFDKIVLPPGLPAYPAITCDELIELAGETAQDLLIADEETRDSRLVELKRSNPSLHALVVVRIATIRAANAEAKALTDPKPKIDVNVTLMQIKKLLREAMEKQGVQLPPELQ